MRKNTVNDIMARIEMVTESGCWIWMGKLSPKGYGVASINGKSSLVHRIFYELFVGPIYEGLQIDHLCRVRSCVNPDHLEMVTLKENVLRGAGVTARNKRKTECSRGHQFTVDNTKLIPGGRMCVACKRVTIAKFWAKRKLQAIKSNQEVST